jgi:hypothetical protein
MPKTKRLGIFCFTMYNRAMKKVPILLFLSLAALCVGVFFFYRVWSEKRQLEKIIERLTAESRIAEVLVTDVKTDPGSKRALTTIKFLEYDTRQRPLAPRYFTFSGNIIQFQSLVIRFDDYFVKKGHPLKGKSAYIFMKVFAFTDDGAEVFDINTAKTVPSGYAVDGVNKSFERKLWNAFWIYALSQRNAQRMGVKNAQIEAPGTKFVKGMLYTIKIEHNGGMRIDAQSLPGILKGEKINF